MTQTMTQTTPLKQVYINSRLHPLPVGTQTAKAAPRPPDWLFSQGDKWLLLTPPRLARLAATLGLEDARITRLLSAVRRWHPRPEDFCRAAGAPETKQVSPRNYIPVACPGCGHVHYPHPEDAFAPCPGCAGRGDPRGARRTAERKADAFFRERLRKHAPAAFDDKGELSPNWRLNRRRRLERDWDSAINRILLGGHYREVAREFDCSVGLLHKKVSEAKYWEWN